MREVQEDHPGRRGGKVSGDEMRLTYEQATAADAESIFAMCKALIDQYEDVDSIDYDKVLQWVRRKIGAQIGEYQRVLMDDALAGYVHFHPDGDRREIDDLYILPEYRGRGIGTAMVEKCCAETEKPVYLYVFRRNEGAVRLYQRLGFVIVQEVGSSRYIMQRG